jgi:7-keto-8-aminopelargonate synthetase-like enzyme
MPKVYVVQQHLARQPDGSFKPKHDISPAKNFGEIVYVLGPKAKPFNMHKVLPDIELRLKNFTSEDYLMLIGNPALIAACATVACRNTNGKVQFLQWSGYYNDYLPIELDLYEDRRFK